MTMFPVRKVPGARPAGWKAKGVRCRCMCHRMPGVKHIAPCCYQREPEPEVEAPAPVAETRTEEEPKCRQCKRAPDECECTGGPNLEDECTCYESAHGHQPGCVFNAKLRARREHAGVPRDPGDR